MLSERLSIEQLAASCAKASLRMFDSFTTVQQPDSSSLILKMVDDQLRGRGRVSTDSDTLLPSSRGDCPTSAAQPC
jgi:hypothetical protein